MRHCGSSLLPTKTYLCHSVYQCDPVDTHNDRSLYCQHICREHTGSPRTRSHLSKQKYTSSYRTITEKYGEFIKRVRLHYYTMTDLKSK